MQSAGYELKHEVEITKHRQRRQPALRLPPLTRQHVVISTSGFSS